MRWKRIAAVVLIPVVFVIAIPMLEEGLFTSPTAESFEEAYAYWESVGGESFEGPVYYDDERHVMVIGEEEFAPDIVPNPDYYVGTQRVLAIAEEVVNPFSGNAFTMILGDETTGSDIYEIPLGALVLYAMKALAWIVLPLVLPRRRKA